MTSILNRISSPDYPALIRNYWRHDMYHELASMIYYFLYPEKADNFPNQLLTLLLFGKPVLSDEDRKREAVEDALSRLSTALGISDKLVFEDLFRSEEDEQCSLIYGAKPKFLEKVHGNPVLAAAACMALRKYCKMGEKDFPHEPDELEFILIPSDAPPKRHKLTRATIKDAVQQCLDHFFLQMSFSELKERVERSFAKLPVRGDGAGS